MNFDFENGNKCVDEYFADMEKLEKKHCIWNTGMGSVKFTASYYRFTASLTDGLVRPWKSTDCVPFAVEFADASRFCPDNWVHSRNSCFKYYEDDFTLAEGANYCKNLQSRLVSSWTWNLYMQERLETCRDHLARFGITERDCVTESTKYSRIDRINNFILCEKKLNQPQVDVLDHELQKEQNMYNDILIIPTSSGSDDTAKLKGLISWSAQNDVFNWLFVTRDDSYVNARYLNQSISSQPLSTHEEASIFSQFIRSPSNNLNFEQFESSYILNNRLTLLLARHIGNLRHHFSPSVSLDAWISALGVPPM